MVLVTFAETKVTRLPGRDPAITSRGTANKCERSVATFKGVHDGHRTKAYNTPSSL